MKKFAITALMIGALLSSGCATRVADLTVASTKNVNMNSDQFVTGPRVTGEDTKYIIVIIPTGTPSVKEAVDQAIEKDHCAVALSDMTMEQQWFYFPYIFGYSTYKAEGNLIIDQSLPGCGNWAEIKVKPVS